MGGVEHWEVWSFGKGGALEVVEHWEEWRIGRSGVLGGRALGKVEHLGGALGRGAMHWAWSNALVVEHWVGKQYSPFPMLHCKTKGKADIAGKTNETGRSTVNRRQ